MGVRLVGRCTPKVVRRGFRDTNPAPPRKASRFGFGVLLRARQADFPFLIRNEQKSRRFGETVPDQPSHLQNSSEQLDSCLSCATRAQRVSGGVSMARKVGQIVQRGARNRSVDAIAWFVPDAEGHERVRLRQALLCQRIVRPRLVRVTHVQFDQTVRSFGV